jgi:hypothetical protein
MSLPNLYYFLADSIKASPATGNLLYNTNSALLPPQLAILPRPLQPQMKSLDFPKT